MVPSQQRQQLYTGTVLGFWPTFVQDSGWTPCRRRTPLFFITANRGKIGGVWLPDQESWAYTYICVKYPPQKNRMKIRATFDDLRFSSSDNCEWLVGKSAEGPTARKIDIIERVCLLAQHPLSYIAVVWGAWSVHQITHRCLRVFFSTWKHYRNNFRTVSFASNYCPSMCTNIQWLISMFQQRVIVPNRGRQTECLFDGKSVVYCSVSFLSYHYYYYYLFTLWRWKTYRFNAQAKPTPKQSHNPLIRDRNVRQSKKAPAPASLFLHLGKGALIVKGMKRTNLFPAPPAKTVPYNDPLRHLPLQISLKRTPL